MPRLHLSFARNTAALLAFCATPAFLAACEGCGETPEPTQPAAARIVAIGLNGSDVASDGTSTATFELRATKEGGGADTTAITVNVTDGDGLLASGTLSSGDLQSVVTPDAGGLATVDVKCATNGEGTVSVTAKNAAARTTFTYRCVRPTGVVRLDLDATDCLSTNRLVADGASVCEVLVDVSLTSNGTTTPQADVLVTISAEATLLDGTEGDSAVLSELATDLGATATITVQTGADGKASFAVRSPELNLVEDLHLAAQAEVAGDVITDTADLSIVAFENTSTLTLVPDPDSVSGGQDVTVSIEATNTRGDPAAGASVHLTTDNSVIGNFGGAAFTDVVLGADGKGTAVLTSTPVTEDTAVHVQGTYSPDPLVPDLHTTTTITVKPAGQPVMVVTLDPTTIASDQNGRATATVKVTREGQPVAGAVVTATVAAADQTKIVLLGAGVSDPATAQITTLANGIATVDIGAFNNRVRAIGHVTFTATVQDVNNIDRDLSSNIEVNVIREPILQSLVWQTSVPSKLGVRGSAFQTSSLVTFVAYDDLGAVLPNVDVQFEVNDTSDPLVTLVAQGITRADGTVSTVVSSGTQALPITVVATARYLGITLRVESLPISIIGGLPSSSNSYMVCDTYSILPPVDDLQCTVQLADRFSNRVPSGIGVQFRAEGGNIDNAVQTGESGAATATYVSGLPNPVGSDVLDWSYAPLLPGNAADLLAFDGPGNNDFDPAGCFDGTRNTPCNLIAMCQGGRNPAFCPLMRDADGASCADAIDLQAVVDTSPAPTALGYYNNTAGIKPIVDAFLSSQRACGFPATCLVGNDRSGISFTDRDDCPIDLGCFDFSPLTDCPHDGLLSIMWSTRGEEGFEDEDGNGFFSYTDLDGNGEYDPGEEGTESFIDFPEPFLDKNGSSVYDQLNDSERVDTTNKIRLSDLFIDYDSNGVFGFGPTAGPITESNGHWDRDTAIFGSTLILSNTQTGFTIDLGTPCTAAQSGTMVTCAYDGQPHLCINGGADGDGKDVGILDSCLPRRDQPLEPGESLDVVYRIHDFNGNCWSPFSVHGEPAGSIFVDSALLFFATEFQLSGEQTISSDEFECGITGTSSDPDRPWIATEPSLGAKVHEFTITNTCIGTTFDFIDEGYFSVGADTFNVFGDARSRTFPIALHCTP